MGNIINDIVEDIDVKPNKTKIILKWVISVSISLISIAFLFGQFKSSFFNRMDEFETSINNNTKAIEELKNSENDGFNTINGRIDKVYDDGIDAFNEFQTYNNKQLELIIDYGGSNKELLKRMLEVNAIEKETSVERRMEKAKRESFNFQPTIGVDRMNNDDYISMVHFVSVETNDTIFYLTGATKKFINNIDRDKYVIENMVENPDHSGLFNVNYSNKSENERTSN